MSRPVLAGPGRFLSRVELSELLGISLRQVDTMRQDGTGPGYVMIGRAVRYPPRQVQEWIDANVVRPARIKGGPSIDTAPSQKRGTVQK